MAVDERTMFEIYRESDYNRAFRYIFYTDLEEHGRDSEIAKAASGVTVFSGFLADDRKEAAREVIQGLVDELNDLEDEVPDVEAIRRRLADYMIAPVSPEQLG